jgi:hypothetical protein
VDIKGASMALLSSAEILQAQAIINQAPLGIYELKVLYGNAWSSITSPTTFGAKFKATVLAGNLRNICISTNSPKSDNHQTYEGLGK